MLEIVLMRTFLILYSSDFEGDDDRHKLGKSICSERRAFTMLSSVCWYWRHTLRGWPESPTRHWCRHQLRKLIKRECTCTQVQLYILLLAHLSGSLNGNLD